MLQGDIKINDVMIGGWTATRRLSTEKGEFRHYDCTLNYRGLDGYQYEAKWEIWGVHGSNGAISLAARVLQEGMVKARRVENTTLKDDALDVMSNVLKGVQ